MAISSESIRLVQKKRKIVANGSRRGVSDWYNKRIAELEAELTIMRDEVVACVASLRDTENPVGQKLRAINAEKTLSHSKEPKS